MANYIVDPQLLEKHLPYKTELDFHNGRCFLSLVAFNYKDTQLRGIRVPFHTQFEEINLRFYIRRKIGEGNWRPGVAFVKLYFPKIALTLVARNIYKENYATIKMRHQWKEIGGNLHVSYGIKNHVWHNFDLIAEKNSRPFIPDSDEAFFNEHYWGYSYIDDRSSTEYEIQHPQWEIHPVKEAKVDVDFKWFFGSEFEVLSQLEPHSVFLAQGSTVTVKALEILK